MLSRSVMSDSLWPRRLEPPRLLCPWDSPGKNTGVGCPALLQGIFPTQGWNLCLLHLLHWQADSLTPCHLGDSPSGTLGVTVCGSTITLLSWMEVSDVFDRDRQEHVKETDHWMSPVIWCQASGEHHVGVARQWQGRTETDSTDSGCLAEWG